MAVITTVLGLTIAFAILEFGLARFYYSNTNELRQDEFDEELGWRLKPGSYVVKAEQAFLTHRVFINQMGLRDAEFTKSPPVGTHRIIVLGDSFTFGQSVDDNSLFSTQLQRRLNEHHPGLSYEVINAGVPGYGTAQELILLRRLANAGVVGDIYLLNVFTNDILDNLRLDYANRSENVVQSGFDLAADGSLRFHKPLPVLHQDSNFVAVEKPSRSKVLSVVKVRLQTLAQTKPGLVRLARRLGMNVTVPRVPGIVSAWYDSAVLDKGVPLTKALIQAIDAEAQRHNGVLLVAMIPSPMQVYTETYGELLRASFPDDPMAKRFLEDPLRAQRIVASICEDLHVPFLDVYDALAATREPLYIPADGHFNEAGHAVFAESLERFVTAHMDREPG